MSKHNRPVNELIQDFRQRQSGHVRMEKQMYERVTVTHGSVNQIALFTTTKDANGIAVTNFQEANKVPQDTMYLWWGIAIDIEVGGSASTRAAAAAAKRWLDAAYLESKGYLTIKTGSDNKTAFEGGPLRIFPGNNGLDGPAAIADTTTAGAANQTLIEAPRTVGLPFRFEDKPLLVLPGERLTGTLDFGGTALSLPSTSNASLLIRYIGYEFTNVEKLKVDQLVRQLNAAGK